MSVRDRQDASGRPLSEGARWRLLEMVYAQSQLLWANAVTIALAGAICWGATGSLAPLAWLGAGLVLSAFRLLDFHSFERSRRTDPPDRIERRFVRGGWALAALWGSASLVLVITPEHVPHILTISAQMGYLASSVARNNAVRRAALGQVCLVLAPLALVCATYPDPYIQLSTIGVLIYLAAAVSTTLHLHRQSVRLLVADDDNAELVRNVRTANAELGAINLRLAAMASTDGLTGSPNRRSFDQRLLAEWRREDDGERPVIGLVLIDIDHFKAYNDRYGHPAGDECLRRVARCVEGTIRRPADFAARFGGEEFAVILPRTDEAAARAVAERIRAAVEALRLPGPWTDADVVTVSIGVAAMPCDPEAEAGRLIAAADERLYRAKRSGRNRVCGEPAFTPISLAAG